MTLEKWLIKPGETRVIDLEDVRKLKVGLIGGQIDVVAHDEPGVRIKYKCFGLFSTGRKCINLGLI